MCVFLYCWRCKFSRFLERGLLGQNVNECVALLDISKFSSRGLVPVCVSTSNVWEYLFSPQSCQQKELLIFTNWQLRNSTSMLFNLCFSNYLIRREFEYLFIRLRAICMCVWSVHVSSPSFVRFFKPVFKHSLCFSGISLLIYIENIFSQFVSCLLILFIAFFGYEIFKIFM